MFYALHYTQNIPSETGSCIVTLFWHVHLSFQKPKPAEQFELPSEHIGYQQHKAHNDKIVTHTVQTSPEMLVEPHREYCIIVATAASSATNMKPWLFKSAIKMKFVAQNVLNVLLSHAHHTLLRKFSTKAMHLPKHTVVA